MNQPSPQNQSSKSQPLLTKIPKDLTQDPNVVVAGVDEAGRGAWAGPVVAAAVVWPADLQNSEINDSKQLTPIAREQLFSVIMENAISVGVGICSESEIDEWGVGQATHVAMQRAVDKLKEAPGLVLVDGYKVTFTDVESVGVVGGDGKYLSIAAASIIAKVTRDRLMIELHGKYPRYGFAIHKGYGTALHQERLAIYGVSKVHRRSFSPIRALLKGTPQEVLAGE